MKAMSSQHSTNTSSQDWIGAKSSNDGSQDLDNGSSYFGLNKLTSLFNKMFDMRGDNYGGGGGDTRPILYLTTVVYINDGRMYTAISTVSPIDDDFFTQHFLASGYTKIEYEHMSRIEFIEGLLIGVGINVMRGYKQL
jgi:hypothetical protein